jgi:glutamine---fructose-6-phosphate transaminase (isomerizing)
MCGIIAYVGNKPCRQIVLQGLSRLEYRGYDSAGFVCVDEKTAGLSCNKEAGGVAPVQRLIESTKFDGTIGIGHTRWATHGVVDLTNAHPHLNCNKSIAVVHNGIIEGHEELRQDLINRGHTLTSTTDSEIATHVLSDLIDQHNDLKAALIELSKIIKGAYGLLFVLEKFSDTLVVMRHRPPMVIGIGNNEMFAASDFLAFSDKTRRVIFMPDDSFAIIKKDFVEIYNFEGKALPYSIQEIDAAYVDITKEGFEHYMLKEIYEQKQAINRTIAFCRVIGSYAENNLSSSQEKASQMPSLAYNDAVWRQLGLTKEKIKSLRYINLISAGTSWHASRIAQFFFESICNIPTRVYLASEFRYMPLFTEPDSIYLFISQSGETADTLEALRLVNSFEQHTIAITNVASSTMVREASGFLPMQAGPEIAVASTKAFSTQVATLYWLANRIALDRGAITPEQMNSAEENLYVAAEVLEAAIEIYKFKIIKELAPHYARFDRFIFLGRHINYPFALEAALKLKEVSYIFAQCYPAGELKHGPIALIDDKTPVVLFSILDELIYSKILSNANEVKARKGHLIVFAFEGQDDLINLADCAFVLPRVTSLLAPLAMAGLMQFFVYQISKQLGVAIDKPRNLAKSVTVE